MTVMQKSLMVAGLVEASLECEFKNNHYYRKIVGICNI